jgi:hypothetical protein
LPRRVLDLDAVAGATGAGSKSKPVSDLIVICGSVLERIADARLMSASVGALERIASWK